MFRRKLVSTECEPFPISNEIWTVQNVSDLRTGLAQQSVDPAQAVAVVVGTAGIPFLMPHLTEHASEVKQIDLSEVVAENVRQRIELLEERNDWPAYTTLAKQCLVGEGHDGWSIEEEVARALASGFALDYALTRDAARAIPVTPYVGDILRHLPRIAEDLRRARKVVSVLHLSNVAIYLDAPRARRREGRSGKRERIVDFISQLPLPADAVIIESYFDQCTPRIYTPQTFREVWPSML